jgi:hypothetical protein
MSIDMVTGEEALDEALGEAPGAVEAGVGGLGVIRNEL